MTVCVPDISDTSRPRVVPTFRPTETVLFGRYREETYDVQVIKFKLNRPDGKRGFIVKFTNEAVDFLSVQPFGLMSMGDQLYRASHTVPSSELMAAVKKVLMSSINFLVPEHGAYPQIGKEEFDMILRNSIYDEAA